MTMGDINRKDLGKCDSVSQANVQTDQDVKEETVDDEFQIDIEEHSLDNRGVDVEEAVARSLNEVGTNRKYSLQVQAKNEAGVSSFKQETVKCDPEETRVFGECTAINSGNQNETISTVIKGEPEESDSSSGVEKIRNIQLNKAARIKEYALQAKSETGFADIDRHNGTESKEDSPHIYQCEHDLKKHVNYNHTENAEWHQCNSCDFKSKNMHVLMIHLEQHKAKSEITKQKYTLKQHINNKHNEMEKESSETYQCQFCECKYRYKQDLKRHINYKHNENSEWYHCNSCLYKTKRKRVLMIHLERHKANREIYRCQFCEYKSKYKYELKKHINYKHSESAQWYQCCFCDHKTKRKSCLVEHFKAKHDENPEMYRCHFCEFKSKVKSYLRRHINHKHTENTEIYCCQLCDGKFKTKTILQKHVKYIHNENVKWYQCNYCNHKTKYIKHLENHVRAKHEKNCKTEQKTSQDLCQE